MKKRHHLAEVIMKPTKLLAALVVALAASACGEAIDINRVAPGAINKKVFTDEWYARGVVVDKQFGTDVSFVGSEGGLERIKWEITENFLVGLRSYERVPGSDPSDAGEQNVIVRYPIVRHFDIRRQYNATNGVEGNIIEENDYDRPWWERDYIRVNWNNQLADNYDIGESTFYGWFGANGSSQNGVNRNANNVPNYPWKVRIGDKLVGDQPVESGDYIETTIDGTLGADPYICYFLDGLSSCNGAQVKLKYSYMKVPKNNDYVALDYPDYVTQDDGVLVVAETNAPIMTSTVATWEAQQTQTVLNTTPADWELPPARICTTAEMDRNGQLVVQVTDYNYTGVNADRTDFVDVAGLRLCNPDPVLGDDPASCRSVVATCDATADAGFVAITPNNNPACDPNHHSPDDCVEITTSVFSRFGYFRTDRFEVDRENGT